MGAKTSRSEQVQGSFRGYGVVQGEQQGCEVMHVVEMEVREEDGLELVEFEPCSGVLAESPGTEVQGYGMFVPGQDEARGVTAGVRYCRSCPEYDDLHFRLLTRRMRSAAPDHTLFL